MKEQPIPPAVVVQLLADHNKAVAEAIAMIVFAIGKHVADPNALFDDLRAISEPDPSHTAPLAIFYRQFQACLNDGEGLDSH